MGWKLFMVCASNVPAPFAEARPNDMARAAAIHRQLAGDGYEYVGEAPLWDAVYPTSADMFVAATSAGVLVCHADMAAALIDDGAWSGSTHGLRPDFKTTLFGLYPKGQVLALALHSVVNLWGFGAYENGQRVRTAGGSADDGVFAQFGEPLPEEAPLLADLTLAQLDEEGAGEELVFAVSSRVFGRGLDQLEGEVPMFSHFRQRAGGPLAALRRLFGRG